MAFRVGQQHLFRLGRLLLGRQGPQLVEVLPHQLHLTADVAVERLHLLAADAARKRGRQALDPQVEANKLVLKSIIKNAYLTKTQIIGIKNWPL